MGIRTLVAYASRTGSTAEIAAEIGKTLSACGFAVDVLPIREKPQLDGYQAVVIGSAVIPTLIAESFFQPEVKLPAAAAEETPVPAMPMRAELGR